MTEQRATYATSKDTATERKLPCIFVDDAYDDGLKGRPIGVHDLVCHDCEAAYNDGVRDRLAAQK